MTEENINKEEESECECGSGKKASDCCQQKDKPYSCGSGKKASDCCEQVIKNKKHHCYNTMMFFYLHSPIVKTIC